MVCFAHALYLVVKKSLDATPGLVDIRSRARKVVAYFKTSTTAKEKLREVQEQMQCPVMKLIQKVDTRRIALFTCFSAFLKRDNQWGHLLQHSGLT